MARRSDRVVIAGNHTLRAARQLNWPSIAVVWTDDDEVTAKAYSLADNRTAELGGYDDDELLAMLAEVHDIDPELLAATGWTEADLAAMEASGIAPAEDEPADLDDIPELLGEPVTKRGDVWLLGRHRIMCGDCRDAVDVAELLAGATINVAVTSPPYAEQRAYDPASGFQPIPPDEYVDWFEAVAANVAEHLADDGSWFVNIKASVSSDGLDTLTYVFDLVLAHVRRWGWHWATEFCWERLGMPGHATQRFKNQFEPVYQFVRGHWKLDPWRVAQPSDAAIRNSGPGVGSTSWADPNSNFGTTQGDAGGAWFDGRVESGLALPGNRLPTFSGSHEALGHTAAFPVGLPAFFIKAYSDPDDVVFDPFMGSGSTLMAAVTNQRIGYGMELSPAYVDLICRRYQRHMGERAVLEATGVAHNFGEAV